MAFMRVCYFSKLLMQHTTLTVAYDEAAATPMPVLYLLHGGTDDSTLWFRESDVEALCHRYGVLAVSLDARSSSYADMRHGQKFFTYMTCELPEFLAHRLPVSTRREDTFIAGFSMGGQGALKAAFRCPDRYAACMGLSGARDTVALYKLWQSMENGPDLGGVEDALGPIDEIYGSENDVLGPTLYWALGNGTPIEIVEAAREAWQHRCNLFNGDETQEDYQKYLDDKAAAEAAAAEAAAAEAEEAPAE